MSFVDDFKDMFSHHADNLNNRLGAIEVKLDDVSKSSDRQARQIEYDVVNMTMPNIKEVDTEVVTVPQGMMFVLTQWTWQGAEQVKPTLKLNGVVVDAPLSSGKGQIGVSKPSELAIKENEKLECANWEGNVTTRYWFQFRVFRIKPKYAAVTGEGG